MRCMPESVGFHFPHCLKKKGTPAARHWSRSERNQSGCDGRARGPLSPPAMTQPKRGISGRIQ